MEGKQMTENRIVRYKLSRKWTRKKTINLVVKADRAPTRSGLVLVENVKKFGTLA